MKTEIRRATIHDMDYLIKLLYQVQEIHACKRPDIFKRGSKKYTSAELSKIIEDDNRPVFVAYSEEGILGYAFCVFEIVEENFQVLKRKILYIDDLCVDEKFRGMKVGSKLFSYVRDFALQNSCNSVTLNVWEINEGARKFYEKMGLKPLKTLMEDIII